VLYNEKRKNKFHANFVEIILILEIQGFTKIHFVKSSLKNLSFWQKNSTLENFRKYFCGKYILGKLGK
jgi:hypothetical protein